MKPTSINAPLSGLAPALVLSSVFATPSVVFAQDSVATIEEVVVSARKRAETLEEAPVSVRAFTAEEIEAAGIQDPADFIALTPNVTLVQTQNAGNSFINVRGVSQARNSELSVAVLVDGVLMPNPAQFNQALFDIEQIEVLRGPQGALYGRNAIGGAITIVTAAPTDEFEGKVILGADDGPGYLVQGAASGPIGSSEDWKFRVSGSYYDTDGWIENEFLGEEADPVEDLSARLRILYEPSDTFSADFRLSGSRLDTQALYFTVGPEADTTDIPVQVNNPGVNERDLYTTSLKLEWYQDYGTFTSITAYDDLEELLTGDQFNFLPRDQALYNFIPLGQIIRDLTGDEFADLSQTQFLDTDSFSQEVRFASPAENRLRWIAGAYAIWTDRYISTGNQVDRGNGVFPVFRTPRPSLFVDPTDPSPQLSLLADAQDNFAWAVFGDISYDLTDTLEGSVSLRYDKDTRENTTLTEPLYDPTGLGLVPGTVREEDWDAWQPKFVLRWRPTDNATYYGSYSRGFRSGGFNQTGVGEAVPEPGVDDIFAEQIADTWEVGGKWTFDGGRYALSTAVYTTDFDNAYFFFFDPTTSTQNLGSIPRVRYNGFEIEGNAAFTDYFDAYFGIGYTDGEIREAADPADVGNQAPLVSEYTINAGGTYRIPMNAFGGSEIVLRADYQRIGDTWWDPGNISVRSPIDLLDLRAGLELPDDWSLTLWVKNATDEIYNAEFSPGPAEGANFLWPALPRQWGATFIKQF